MNKYYKVITFVLATALIGGIAATNSTYIHNNNVKAATSEAPEDLYGETEVSVEISHPSKKTKVAAGFSTEIKEPYTPNAAD